jgi:hypothetical protein
VLFDAARPVILNGIEDIVTRPDLADRAVFLTLEAIPEGRRRRHRHLLRVTRRPGCGVDRPHRIVIQPVTRRRGRRNILTSRRSVEIRPRRLSFSLRHSH